MPNFCGGIRLDGVTLKVINGVICEATADSVNVDDAVSTCGQLWDGAVRKSLPDYFERVRKLGIKAE